MQIKSILLLVVIGGVSVLAKKGSSSEEDVNGYNISLWPYGKPGRGPKPQKFKGPKHQIFVVGRPRFPQQPLYPSQYLQMPQYPQVQIPQVQYPSAPQFPQEQQSTVNPFEVQQYLENVQRQMQEFSAKAYKEFQLIENNIDRNRKQMEDMMKSQFQTLELALEAKQAKEIQQAVKEGKDEAKIQECMAEEEDEARTDMNADIQRTTDCINDATERARKVLNDARNAYTETSIFSSMQAREWAQKIRSCAEQRDGRCVQEGMSLINDKTKTTVEEGNQYFQKLQDAPQSQMIQMKYCRENFMDDLRDMKEEYTQMVKRCVIASEIQKPEDSDEEENPNVNLEVKPAVEPKSGTEVDV